MKGVFEIISYDVWGNAREGFWVNQAFCTGQTVEVSEGDSDAAINRRLGSRGITWEGEIDYTLYGTLKRNGRPALELRRVGDAPLYGRALRAALPDGRYTVSREFCGDPGARYVARFCDEWIGCNIVQSGAIALAHDHYKEFCARAGIAYEVRT